MRALDNALIILGIIAAAIAVYGWSLRRRPMRDCWRCHGSKSNEDTTLWKGAWGSCLACGGTGRRIRWGVVLFMRETYRNIKAGGHGRYY